MLRLAGKQPQHLSHKREQGLFFAYLNPKTGFHFSAIHGAPILALRGRSDRPLASLCKRSPYGYPFA